MKKIHIYIFSLVSVLFLLFPDSILADGEGPLLEEVEVTPKIVHVGDTVEVKAKVTDAKSTVTHVEAIYENPSNNRYLFMNMEYDISTGLWIGRYTVTSSDEAGIWTIDHWFLQDSAKNSSGVYDSGPEANFEVNGKVKSLLLDLSSPSPEKAGTPIELTATSTGSNTPEYRFFVRNEQGELSLLQEYGSNGIISWTPEIPGKYEIIVHVKDNSRDGSYYFYEVRAAIVYEIH
ncbi:triple tyrosine motif-containing protein [Sediminibacillus massiliensis]|uniref:triple tyrosine motif-containing protein n=1 Tax=Sediminibacillus massiliensis TaxID=1926277 RepID=UPI0015C3649E|nr:triple tyrosine motif-containing protein [Sediminibacillus massiliensis]